MVAADESKLLTRPLPLFMWYMAHQNLKHLPQGGEGLKMSRKNLIPQIGSARSRPFLPELPLQGRIS